MTVKHLIFFAACAAAFALGSAIVVANLRNPTRPVLIFAGVLIVFSISLAFATDVTTAAGKVLAVVGPYFPAFVRRGPPTPPRGD